MYSDWVGLAVAGFLVVWLMGLSFSIWQQRKFLMSLFPKSGERDIRKKFEEVTQAIDDFDSRFKDLDSRVNMIQAHGLKHIQKAELLRFNPYDDTGGNISFTIALLDEEGSGIVLTSLHARGGTRIFAKPVILGKSNKYELSKEEESVIKKAIQ